MTYWAACFCQYIHKIHMSALLTLRYIYGITQCVIFAWLGAYNSFQASECYRNH